MQDGYHVYEIDGIVDFEPDHIFDCGQSFRWEQEKDGSYTGIAFGKAVNMQYIAEKEAGCGRLRIENCTENEFLRLWRPYLDLDRDYGKIKKVLAERDPIMAEAIAAGQGIRILKQDLWETMVSFIISQNNNIPRIKGCIEALAVNFGSPAGRFRGREYFNIPPAETLARLEAGDLAACRLGYRATYLVETARQVIEMGGPEQVARQLAGAEDPAAELTGFCGIGPKVANCIALFGVGRYDAFPDRKSVV